MTTVHPIARDISRAWLYAGLRGADLTGANLTGANLTDAKLTGTNLTGANLRGADLTGADLSGADLTGADLRSAYLTDANLRGADLTGADLRGADLRGEKITRVFARLDREQDACLFAGVGLEAGGYKILAGCRWFDDAEFRAHVAAEYPDTDKAVETLALLDFIAARAAR